MYIKFIDIIYLQYVLEFDIIKNNIYIILEIKCVLLKYVS